MLAICPDSGKLLYPSHAEASKAAAWQHHGAYRCDSCGGWHTYTVGRRKARKRRKLRHGMSQSNPTSYDWQARCPRR